MNIQRKHSAHHFRMQSESEQFSSYSFNKKASEGEDSIDQ